MVGLSKSHQRNTKLHWAKNTRHTAAWISWYSPAYPFNLSLRVSRIIIAEAKEGSTSNSTKSLCARNWGRRGPAAPRGAAGRRGLLCWRRLGRLAAPSLPPPPPPPLPRAGGVRPRDARDHNSRRKPPPEPRESCAHVTAVVHVMLHNRFNKPSRWFQCRINLRTGLEQSGFHLNWG